MASRETPKYLNSKENYKQEKRQLSKWEKIIVNEATDKGLPAKYTSRS